METPDQLWANLDRQRMFSSAEQQGLSMTCAAMSQRSAIPCFGPHCMTWLISPGDRRMIRLTSPVISVIGRDTICV